MRVVGEVQEFLAQGPPKFMQDEAAHRVNKYSGANILGVFDGYGHDGSAIALTASRVINEAANEPHPYERSAYAIARIIGAKLRKVSEGLTSQNVFDNKFSGSTATVAVVYAGQLAVAYLGDSRAAYYPENELSISLVHPHNRFNPSEKERAEAMGGRLIDQTVGTQIAKYWVSDGAEFGVIHTRGVSGDAYSFMSNEADYAPTSEEQPFELHAPGYLVVGTKGFWGPNLSIERDLRIHAGGIDQAYVDETAQLNNDNAAVIVARIN